MDPPHMAEQKQDGQLEHTYSSSVRIRDVALKTCQRRETIGRCGERGSGISVLAARHDDNDIYIYICVCVYKPSVGQMRKISGDWPRTNSRNQKTLLHGNTPVPIGSMDGEKFLKKTNTRYSVFEKYSPERKRGKKPEKKLIWPYSGRRHLVTESVCVHRWISDTLTGKARVNTRAAGEMLVRRRLGTLRSLKKEYGLTIDVKLVKSCQNCADCLTRVPHRWMDLLKEGKEPVLESCAIVGRWLDKDQVADIHHQSGHSGAKRSLYFARLVDPQVSKETANSVLKACKTCRSIDPAPVRWKKGVKDNWNRLAMDITHHNGENFLLSTVAPLDLQYGGHCADKMRPLLSDSWRIFPRARPTDGNTDWQRHCIH